MTGTRRHRGRLIGPLAVLGLLAALLPTSAGAATDPVINEFVFNHTGTDTDEFIEVFGDPSTDYSGLTLVEIEGDGTGAGAIDDGTFPVGTTDASGFWATGFQNNLWENGTVTQLLVEGFTGTVGQDLDTDNDCALNVTPWTRVVDDVGVNDGGSGDCTYSSVVLSAFFDGMPFSPGGASRIPNGTDTNSTSDWVRNDFNGAGLPSFPTAVAPPGLAINTPGTSNQVAVTPPLVLTIPEIQGDGQFSVYEGEVVTTTGVVTLYSANGRDFWMQDPDGDGDAATSDGIVVDDGGFLPGPPQIGDFIEITAVVQEQQFGNALPLTRLDSPSTVTIMSSGNPLPAPISLTDLPNEVITDGIDFWEPLEGMRVSGSGPVMAATNGFGEFGFLAEADTAPGSGYFADPGHLIIRSLGPNEVDYNPERIMVDDTALDTPDVRPGDMVNSAVGVVDYTFSMYKLQLASLDVTTHPLPETPVSERTLTGRDFGDENSQGRRGVSITSFNVENLFDLVDNPDKDDIGTGGAETPAELEVQLAKLALAVRTELALPEIVVAQEVENTAVLQEIGDRVNAASGTDYTAVSFETSDGRGIEVGLLWDADRVELLDAFQITEAIVPGTEAAFGPTSPSPGREPLVGLFRFDNQDLWIVGNHFKSKSGDDPLYGVNQPPIRVTEVQRKAQAQVVRTFVNSILDDDRKALVMVTGDLNDFQFGEPGEGPDHPVAIVEGGPGEVPLTNLVHFEDPSEQFSFVFDGNSQVLDHMLVSPRLMKRLNGVDFLRFNTSYFDSLNSDPSTPLRAADHDPLEGRFHLKTNK